MKCLKTFLMVSVFFVDVRVKASDTYKVENFRPVTYKKLSEPVQEPIGCLNQQVVCALSTYDKSRYEMVVGSTQLILGGRTTVIRNDADLITIIAGELWVKTNGHIKIQSEFGSYELGSGEAWIIRENGKMLVRSVANTGGSQVTPRGGDALPVPAGFEMWISAVSTSGMAKSAIPQAIDFRDHMRRWARLFTGNKKEFEKEVSAFRDVWMDSVEKASVFHLNVIQRKIASEEEEAIKKQKTLEQIKRENQRLRTLFRKKLSIED